MVYENTLISPSPEVFKDIFMGLVVDVTQQGQVQVDYSL